MSVPNVPITDNDVLYYLHLPKTAGTSFTDIITSKFSPEAYFHPIHPYEFSNPPPGVAERARFVAGHWFYDLSPIITRNLIYITVLREPLDRTISQYAQITRHPTHFAYNQLKSQSLLEFVKDPLNRYIWADAQTRQLGVSTPTVDLAIGLKHPAEEFSQRIMDYPPTRDEDAALLPLAQERLGKFAVVGLTEHFEESIEVLCDTFGWDVPEAQTVLNVAGNRPTDIPQEALDIIHENTRLDAALYETGRQIFEARYKQMVADHPEREHNTVIDLDSVNQKLKRLALLQVLTKQLEADKAQMVEKLLAFDTQTRRLTEEINRLSQIESSFGWRFILRVSALRRKLIPQGSFIENVYLKIRNRLA